MKEPADLRSPAAGEVMSQAEAEMISELVSDEQMKLMILGAERRTEEAKAEHSMVVTTPGTDQKLSVLTPPLPAPVPAPGPAGESLLMGQAKEIAEKTGQPLPLVLRDLKGA